MGGKFSCAPLFVDDKKVSEPISGGSVAIYNVNNSIIVPGFTDVHVHLREPGFSYKETIESGTRAAAAGGYTTVCSMPNLNPAPDSAEAIKQQLNAIKKGAAIRVYPYASITKGLKGEALSDMEELAPLCIAFTDDGKGVQKNEMMLEAMKTAKALGKMIVAHCEDESLLIGGCIHDGEFARKNGFRGISSESEWRQVERDLELAAATGCKYHVCHISTKETVGLIRQAKKSGVDVTCETAPHYLILCDQDLKDEGRFKMNPPIRSEADREALVEGLIDGTIDMIATDHAPHSAEEKSKGLKGSLMGVSGLECAFAAVYTNLVKPGVLPLERLIDAMSITPRRRFGIPGGTEIGDDADFTVINLDESFTVRGEDFISKGKFTPFEGRKFYGKVKLTAVKGEIVWQATLH